MQPLRSSGAKTSGAAVFAQVCCGVPYAIFEFALVLELGRLRRVLNCMLLCLVCVKSGWFVLHMCMVGNRTCRGREW